jgi:GT2 family glycosyltransferase
VDEKTGFIAPEDFFFCSECRKIGIPFHIVPGAVTKHLGQFDFNWDATSIAERNARKNAAQSAVT